MYLQDLSEMPMSWCCLIYTLPEKSRLKVSTADVLAEKIRRTGRREVFRRDKEGAVEYVLSEMKKGDVLLTLGAGDVWKLGEKVLERLNAV